MSLFTYKSFCICTSAQLIIPCLMWESVSSKTLNFFIFLLIIISGISNVGTLLCTINIFLVILHSMHVLDFCSRYLASLAHGILSSRNSQKSFFFYPLYCFGGNICFFSLLLFNEVLGGKGGKSAYLISHLDWKRFG